MVSLNMIDDKNVAPVQGDFDPLPPGKYLSAVTESEMRATKSGGEMLTCVETIQEGNYKGRKIWTNFNVVNASEKAQQIGRGQLSALSQACGLPGIPDESEALHGIAHWIKVGTEASPGYADKNVVKAWYPIESPHVAGAALPKSITEDKLPDTGLPF